jgi:ABC-2 type transport system permease protein
MTAFRALLRSEFHVFLRDKTSLTFTFLFPLLFIVIFGYLMGGTGSAGGSKLGLVVAASVDGSRLESVIAEVGVAQVERYAASGDLEKAIDARDVDFGAVWDGATLTFVYDVRRTQENFAFEELARGIVVRFDLANQGRRPLLDVVPVVEGGEAGADWFTLVVPGILAFSVLSAGLFAVAGHVTSMKQRRLLERLVVTPMSPVAFLAAIVVVRLGVVFLSTLATLGTAVGLFHVAFHMSWLHYVVFVVAATVGTMGLGTVIALVVRQPSSASSLANVLSMLMLFVSGVYFPIEIMPSFLRALSMAMPLRHMADAMRYTTGVMDMSELRFWVICGTLLLGGLALLPILSRYVVRAERR